MDEQLYRGIVSIEAIGLEKALADVQRFAQQIAQQMQAMGGLGSSASIGEGLAADLSKAESAIERLLRAQGEMRAQMASRVSDPGAQEMLRTLDALIAKTEQLRRVQALPPPTDTSNEAQLRRAQLTAELAREDARLRGGAGVYGEGLAGNRREAQVNRADARVTGANSDITKGQAALARAMQERLAVEEAAAVNGRQLSAAEDELTEAIRRREAGIEAQREIAGRFGRDTENIRPKAADELDVRAAERRIAGLREQQAALALQSGDVQQKVLAAETRILKGEMDRAAAIETANLTRSAAVAGAGKDEGVRVNYDDVLARARSEEASTHEALLQAQLGKVAADERLTAATNRKYADETQATAAVAAAGRSQQAAALGLNKAIEAHAAAEAAAATAATQAAEAKRVAGDPRRAALLDPDSKTFLESEGVATSGSIRMQELAIEQQRLAQSKAQLLARAKAVTTEAELSTLVAQREALERRILANTQAQTRQRYTESGRGGFVGGLFGNFNGSPEGVTRADIGFQAGQAAKFYALYTAMSMVQTGISSLISISAEYSLAVADLAVAMGTSTAEAEKAAEGYAKIGAEMGTGPLESLQGAGKFARTYRDPLTQQTIPGAAEQGARIASSINILEGAERIPKMMQDLIAVMGAYDRAPDQAMSVYDQTQSISQRYGFQSGEVLGGTAALADLGKESGYSLPELTALIASVMQATGTTSDAVAGDVKRILGSQDSADLNRVFEKWGINLDQNFQQRIGQLADVLQTLPEEQRSREITGLANDPRTGASFAAMVNGVIAARAAVSGAEAGSAGLVDRQVEQRLEAFGGELKKLQANLFQAAIAVGDVGITQMLTTLAHALNGAASMVVVLANGLDAIPDPIKEVVVWLGAMALAAKGVAATRTAFAGNSILSGIAPGVGGRAARADLSALQAGRDMAIATGSVRLAESYSAQIAAATQTQGAMARLTTGVRGLGSAAIASAGPLAVAAAIMAGFTIAGDAKGKLDDYDSAVANAKKLGTDVLGKPIADRDAYQAAIEELLQNAQTIRKTDDGVSGWFASGKAISGIPILGSYINSAMGGDRGDVLEGQAKSIEDRAKWAQEEIKAFDARMAATTGDEVKAPEYFGENGRLATYRIEQIKQQGMGPASATRRLDQLISEQSLDTLFPKVQGEKGVEELMKVIVDRIQQSNDPVEQQESFGALRNALQKLRARTAGSPDESEAARQLIAQANKLYVDALVSNTEARIANLKSMEGKNPLALGEIKTMIKAALDAATEGGDVNATAQLLGQVDQAFVESYRKGIVAQILILRQQADAISKAAAAAKALAVFANPLDPNAAAAALAPTAQQAEADARLKASEEALKTLDRASGLANYTGSAFKWPGEKEEPKFTPEELEEARIASTARPGDSLQNARVDLQLAKYKLDNAKKGTPDYYNALKALRDAQFGLAQAELEASVARLSLNARPGDAMSQATVNVQIARKQLSAAVGTTEYYVALKALQDAQYELSRAALDQASARIGAGAIAGDNYSQAVAQVKIAQMELKAAVGKTEYWDALKGLRDAQYELATQQLEAVKVNRMLSSDITDPVAQARIEVEAAKAKLAFDRNRGASATTIAQDQLELQQAQAAAASTAWGQQFGDMQTNYDLNRISLSAYLKYLNSQKAYLEAVKNKTRDQVEQLNQVDQALKGLADSLQGQWNLGDIRMPTPYEVRSAMTGNQAALTTNNIQINGADTAAVMDMLTRLLGVGTIQAASTTPAKV